jgi:hypothetical protein
MNIMKIKLLLLSFVTLLVSFIAKANNDPCNAQRVKPP